MGALLQIVKLHPVVKTLPPPPFGRSYSAWLPQRPGCVQWVVCSWLQRVWDFFLTLQSCYVHHILNNADSMIEVISFSVTFEEWISGLGDFFVCLFYLAFPANLSKTHALAWEEDPAL